MATPCSVLVLALIALTGASSVSPVSKVVGLLKEMKDTLEKEAEEDQKIYDDMVCWCETNEKAKTKAIADGIARDKKLTALIPELAATKAQLKVEIEQLQKEAKANEAALGEATEIRAKELAEFREEETTAVASVTGLTNAIRAVGKNHALDQETLLQVKQLISSHSKNPEVSSLRGRRIIASFLQQQGTTHLQSQQPQSGAIFGILKGMKESFEQNLANSQKEEAEGVAEYNQLKSAKESEISAALTQVETKQAELAETGETLESSKEELPDTREQVSADQKFLMDLQTRCGTMDKEFADRSKIRSEETKAVNEALKILTDDDAHDLFAKSTFVQEPASLIQTEASGSKRAQALKVLRNAGIPKLSFLALSMKDDVFEKVKAVVDDLIVQLKKQQEDDVEQRDVCIDEMNTNEKELAARFSMKKDIETKLESLNLTIEKLKDEIVAAKAEIEETQKEKLKASENRELENKEFQTTVTEQRATQGILNKALKKLQDFYADKAAALLQVHVATGVQHKQAPPPSFAPMKKNEGATGVVGMIENIIAESKEVEHESVAAEQEAQAAYETFMKDSNDAVDALTKSISDKTKQSEKADAARIQSEADLRSVGEDIDGLETLGNTLHGQCDFLLKNFEVRQSSRTSEMEALEEAKALMSGASA